MAKNTKKRKWFQKGAFEDGYQFGDIFRTIRSTGKDIAKNFYEGAVGIAEKTIDTGAYIAGGVGGLFGADNFKDKTAEFIKKDIIDEKKVSDVIVGLNGGYLNDFIFGKNDVNKNSVLGDKSDDLVKSGGQLAGQIGLQATGVPWWVTTGVTSFGSSVEEALNEGASYGKAGLNATIAAGTEILTEKLFGGSGLGEKGLINTEPLTKWISNKAAKTFADYGVDMLAEGIEEVFSQFMGNLSSSIYKRGKLKDILFSKEAAEVYLESFIGGAVLSGFTNGGNVGESTYNSTDYRNGLTKNEQKVFDRSYGEKIVEAKADNGGAKLTGEQRAKIYDNTLQQVKSGNVSTEIIESSLGGKDYSTYKNASDNYDILEQELQEIETEDNKFKTQEQAKKGQEIRQRLEQIKTKADELKRILQNKVAEKIDTDNIHLKSRESYLWDSYTKGLSKPAGNALKDSALSDASNHNIQSVNDIKENINRYSQEEDTNSKAGVALSLKDNDVKVTPHAAEKNGMGSTKNIDEKEFVEGLWDTGKSAVNSESAEYVENSGLKLFDNADESGIIEENVKELTLNNLTKDVLKTKPSNSRVPKDWIEAGGSIAIDNNGNWIYTDWFGVRVKYIDGYPDYEGAGAVVQKVNIGSFKSRGIDARKANHLAPNGPRHKNNVWHHSQDGCTMQEVIGEIHRRFTHKGGFALRKRKE